MMHLTRHAVSVSTKKNDRISRPVITAPRMLVATNSTARSTIANSTVAIMAPRSTVMILFTQQGDLHSQQLTDAAVMRTMARYTTAMPKTVHKNAGVTVMAAVILRKAAMMPTTMLIMRATVVQLPLQVQLLSDIISPPDTLYVSFSARCKRGGGAQAKSAGFCRGTPMGVPLAESFAFGPEPPIYPLPQTRQKQLSLRELSDYR